jgi:TolB-like protein/DNA-binding winged helix-turn-helix (wHTH) protein/Flp pilus assembly protein TadD
MSNSDVVYYDFDNFRLDVEKQKLLKNGEPVLLTHKAFQTLQILVQNFGQTVKKEDIYNELWTDSFVEDANLTQYIYLLRKTLDKNGEGVSYIETVARKGYVFTAKVKTVCASEISVEPKTETNLSESIFESAQISAAPADELQSNVSSKNGSSQAASWFVENENGKATRDEKAETLRAKETASEKSENLPWTRRLSFAQLLLVFTLAVALGLIIYFQTEKSNAPTISPSSAISSIAVLPLQPIDEESRTGKVGLGMANAIITRLSKLQKIPVRPTSSIFRYTDEPVSSVSEAGRELGVDAVLEGTVQRVGERVRVSVQLVRIADGKPMWAETFDEKSGDIFALQDSISSRVAQSLALKLTPQQWKLLEQRPTNNTEAFEAYQLGVYFWNTRTKENLQKAVAHFQKAIEIDPNFAESYAMLADTYNMLGYYRFADSAEMKIKARAAAEKAIVLDDSVAEAHIAIAFIQLTPESFQEAQRSIERAIELAPYNSTARVRHGWILFRLGRVDEAVKEMKLAQEYDPLSPVSNGALCNVLTYRENFGEAVKVCEKAVELAPNAADNRLALANAYFYNGNSEDAIKQAKTAIEEGERKFSALGSLGYFYAKLNRRGEADAIVAQLKTEAQKDAGLYNDLTLITYALGRRDESFAYFQKAYKNRVLPMNLVHIDPAWKQIRDDVEFIKLLGDSER